MCILALLLSVWTLILFGIVLLPDHLHDFSLVVLLSDFVWCLQAAFLFFMAFLVLRIPMTVLGS